MCAVLDKMEKRGERRGEAIGEARGEIEKAKDVALKMHMNGMTNSFIAEIVGYAENVVAGWIAAAQS